MGGSPIKTTWAGVEDTGHEIGKLVPPEYDQIVQRRHAEKYDDARCCRQSGKATRSTVKHRELTARFGTGDSSEPEFRCTARERFSFPRRMELGIGGDQYSPAVIERFPARGGALTLSRIAANVIQWLMDLDVPARTLDNKTKQIGLDKKIGLELTASRGERTNAHLRRPITENPKVAEPAVASAQVQVDGGRVHTRAATLTIPFPTAPETFTPAQPGKPVSLG